MTLPDGVTHAQKRFQALSKITGKEYYTVPSSQVGKVRAAAAADGSDGVIQVFPNIIKHLEDLVPDDAQFASQYCHYNPASPASDMDSTQAWEVSTGSPEVVVALIDSGVDYTHPDLVENIWVNPGEIPDNGIDDDGNGYVDDVHGIDTGDDDSDPMDYNGHGTHVAGIMGAEGNNGLGVCGVNWQVKIMILKGFETASDGMDTSMEIEAIDYILTMKARGVNIVSVNGSYGYIGEEDILEKEAIAALGEVGILFMAAAGNEGNNNDANPSYTHYPSSCDLDNLVSVAASDANGQLAWFSSYGATTVDLAAPGDEILSTVMAEYYYTPAQGDLFYDDMESGTGEWTAEGTWDVTQEQAHSPVSGWSDSPGGRYDTNQDMMLTSPVIDLSQIESPIALGFHMNYEIETAGIEYFDSLQIWYLAPGDNEPVWVEIGAVAGSSNGQWEVFSYLIPERYFWEGFQFRFVLHSDYSIQKDGVYIDDVGIGVAEADYPCEYYSGTSMATPQVTGAAGLVASAYPDLGAEEIKFRLLEGVQPMKTLENKVLTGGILNLAGALSGDSDGDGILDGQDNCAATANADQKDSDEDGWGDACDCDLTNDGIVNQADFMLFRSYWGTTEPVADFNGDNTVNQADFMILRNRWGSAAPFE